jgi:anti-sigma regulatory factor (Ser/Thr protein kinase)
MDRGPGERALAAVRQEVGWPEDGHFPHGMNVQLMSNYITALEARLQGEVNVANLLRDPVRLHGDS